MQKKDKIKIITVVTLILLGVFYLEVGKSISLYTSKSVKEYNSTELKCDSIINNDTIILKCYEGDTLIYEIKTDLEGKRIDDQRKILHKFNKTNYSIRDTILIEFIIKGPSLNNYSCDGAIYPEALDISRNKTLKGKTSEGKDYLTFIPRTSGKHICKVAIIDFDLLKTIGQLKIEFSVF